MIYGTKINLLNTYSKLRLNTISAYQDLNCKFCSLSCALMILYTNKLPQLENWGNEPCTMYLYRLPIHKSLPSIFPTL